MTNISRIPSASSIPSVSPTHSIPEINDIKALRKALENSPIPTIVKIGASWSDQRIACDAMLNKLAKKHEGKVNFIKVDSGKAYAISDWLKPRFFPFIRFFKPMSILPLNDPRPEQIPNCDENKFDQLISEYLLK